MIILLYPSFQNNRTLFLVQKIEPKLLEKACRHMIIKSVSLQVHGNTYFSGRHQSIGSDLKSYAPHQR